MSFSFSPRIISFLQVERDSSSLRSDLMPSVRNIVSLFSSIPLEIRLPKAQINFFGPETMSLLMQLLLLSLFSLELVFVRCEGKFRRGGFDQLKNMFQNELFRNILGMCLESPFNLVRFSI